MGNIVYVEGSPYEIGYGIGEKFRDEVSQLINLYKGFWTGVYGLTEGKLVEHAREVSKLISKWNSSIAEEIRGLGDGAGVGIESATLLNARYDITYMFRSRALEGCTAIGILPERSLEGETILAQNWDYTAYVKDYSRLIHVRYDDGLEVIYHGETGVIGQKGMNSSGVGIVFNAIPFLLLIKKVLKAGNMKEAVEAAINTPISVSGNIIIAYKGGEVIDIEPVPGDYRIIYPIQGILVHTNHLIGGWPGTFKDLTPHESGSTFYRYYRALRKLSSIEKPSIEDLKNIFRDHFSYPNSICAHKDPKDPMAIETLASIILRVDKGIVEIAEGNPCKNRYESIELHG